MDSSNDKKLSGYFVNTCRFEPLLNFVNEGSKVNFSTSVQPYNRPHHSLHINVSRMAHELHPVLS